MSNIIEADRKRKVSEEAEDKEEELSSAVGKPPTKKLKHSKKKTKRLTDLDVDNGSESEITEYEASASDKSEDPEPSEDEYLPSEFKRGTRRYFLVL